MDSKYPTAIEFHKVKKKVARMFLTTDVEIFYKNKF